MTNERTLRGAGRHAPWLVLALLGALVLGAVASAAAGAQSVQGEGDKTREYEVPAEVMQPEGVVYDEQTNAFYGGSNTPDGTVYKSKLKGAKLKKTKVFMATGQDGAGETDNRAQTQGFNVDEKGRLYIAGAASGQLNVYKLPKGKKIAQFTVSGSYINDVAVDPNNGDVYFTDSINPAIYRVTEQQVKDGTGTPETFVLDDPMDPNDVDYTKGARTLNPLEANGIRFTPGGEYIIFNSLNNGELYRLDPESDPADPAITKITGVTPAELGNQDGLEFLNENILYALDNAVEQAENPAGGDESPERLLKLRLSNNYTEAEILEETPSEEFRTPTGVSLAPEGRLLITNAELFDTSEPGAPFHVLSIPRP